MGIVQNFNLRLKPGFVMRCVSEPAWPGGKALGW